MIPSIQTHTRTQINTRIYKEEKMKNKLEEREKNGQGRKTSFVNYLYRLQRRQSSDNKTLTHPQEYNVYFAIYTLYDIIHIDFHQRNTHGIHEHEHEHTNWRCFDDFNVKQHYNIHIYVYTYTYGVALYLQCPLNGAIVCPDIGREQVNKGRKKTIKWYMGFMWT